MKKKRKPRTSRLEKVKKKKEIQQAVLYFILAGGIIVAIFVWGLPALAKLSGLFIKDTGQVSLEIDQPVTTPVLNEIPEATNSATFKLNGFAEAGSEVEIYLNNVKATSVLADKNGNFEAVLDLSEGDNWLYAQAKRGNKLSPKSRSYHLILDTTKPEITITNPPADKTEFNGDEEKTITIEGEVNKEVDEVKVGDRIAIVQDGTKFRTNYELNEGDNEIEIIAKDRAGNIAKTTLKLVWHP